MRTFVIQSNQFGEVRITSTQAPDGEAFINWETAKARGSIADPLTSDRDAIIQLILDEIKTCDELSREHTTLAEQALEQLADQPKDSRSHPWDRRSDAWEIFNGFQLHPYSRGITYSGGTWMADEGFCCVFQDGSSLIYNETYADWELSSWNLDEQIEDDGLNAHKVEIKQIIELALTPQS